MKVSGIIKVIQETKQHTTEFKTRDVVIETQEQYPQLLSIQFVNSLCGVLENYTEGQEVEISINLRGREWTSPQGEVKYFNTIQGWKISEVGPAPVKREVERDPASGAAHIKPQVIDEDDDLPF